MPMAARLTDLHTCPMSDGPKPHVGGPVSGPGVPTVLIGGVPAAVVGDLAACASAPDVIAKGSATVLIGGRPAARQGDTTAHGGLVAMGFPTVIIGDAGGGGSAGSGAGATAVGQAAASAANGSGSGGQMRVGGAVARADGRGELSPQAHALLDAAQEGIALVERCPLAGTGATP